MTNQAGPPTPAGWFRDPGGSDQLRWWDGAAWTAHLTPMPQPTPAPAGPVQQPPSQPPVIPTPAFTQTPTVGQVPSSVASEPEERPYVPFQNQWAGGSGGYGNSGAAEFARPAQWNTGGAWVLGASPLWIIAVESLVAVVDGGSLVSSGTATSQGAIIALLALLLQIAALVAAAVRDQKKLKQLGYLAPANAAWILLGPLIYLIVRTVKVYGEAKRGIAPLILYLVSIVGIVLLGIVAAVAIPAFIESRLGVTSASADSANAASLASGIATGMDKNGGSYSVTCRPFAKPTSSPIDVTCTAIDQTSKVSHTIDIEIDPGVSGGQPTVKLISVTPPISQ